MVCCTTIKITHQPSSMTYTHYYLSNPKNFICQFNPDVAEADPKLNKLFKAVATPRVTLTAGGLYKPQDLIIRIESRQNNLIFDLRKIRIKGFQIANMEMETAGIYELATILGHRAISLNTILANRVTGTFSTLPKSSVNI